MVENSSTETSAFQEQQAQLKEVLSYLAKKETRGAALDIILPFTASKEQRALFSELEICKTLMRLLPEEQAGVSQKVAQCLINLSVDQEYVNDMITLNVAGRVFDFLKEQVQMNMKPVENSHAAFNEDEKIYEIRQLALAKNDSQAVFDTIELLSMLLCNVTVSEEG
jgi:hypothetical protein